MITKNFPYMVIGFAAGVLTSAACATGSGVGTAIAAESNSCRQWEIQTEYIGDGDYGVVENYTPEGGWEPFATVGSSLVLRKCDD